MSLAGAFRLTGRKCGSTHMLMGGLRYHKVVLVGRDMITVHWKVQRKEKTRRFPEIHRKA